jgi:hypothetical protein
MKSSIAVLLVATLAIACLLEATNGHQMRHVEKRQVDGGPPAGDVDALPLEIVRAVANKVAFEAVGKALKNAGIGQGGD